MSMLPFLIIDNALCHSTGIKVMSWIYEHAEYTITLIEHISTVYNIAGYFYK